MSETRSEIWQQACRMWAAAGGEQGYIFRSELHNSFKEKTEHLELWGIFWPCVEKVLLETLPSGKGN